LAIVIIGMYNSLIRLKNRVDEAWSDIDVQLKRRYDLIPNLVETVKGYAGHEKDTLEKVTKARTDAMAAQGSGDAKKQAAAENMLSSTLKSQASRRFYNGNVRDFNTKLEVFPTNIIGNVLGFKSREYFEIEDEKERDNVKVKF